MSRDAAAWRARVVARYDAGARAYDELWSPVIVPPAVALVAALPISHARRVLDVGCGAGVLRDTLRRAVPGAAVLGADASLGMLRLARDRGLPVVRADAAALPVAAGSVDAVVLAYVLFHLADPAAALRCVHAALRPGGVVGTITWASERGARADEVVTAALDAAGAPPPPTVSDHGATDTVEKVRALLSGAAFRAERVWTVPVEHVFTPDALLALRVEGGVGRCRFDGLAPAARAAVTVELTRRLATLPSADFAFAGELVLAVGSRP